MDLGNNRCRRNSRHGGVAFDNRLRLHGQQRQAVAVHQHEFGRQAQAGYRALHGQKRGLQDVDLVNFLGAGLRNRTAQGLGQDFVEQALTLARTQRLGIGQARNRFARIQNDGSRHDRPHQRPATRLVHTGDQTRRVQHRHGGARCSAFTLG